MPVELGRAAPVVRPNLFALAAGLRRRGFVEIHPRFRHWLTRHGLTSAQAFLDLRGEILSGHHDRHVMRVEFPGGRHPRVAYIKRELRVGWQVRRRNRRDGFGPVSRSVREARMLGHLETLGLGGPQWMACGEDERGRAFLLVHDLAGHEELRLAARRHGDPKQRRELAAQIGRSLADLHRAAISTPDLAAKHVFLRAETGGVALVDWPSARIGEAIAFTDRAEALAQLDASLVESLASPRERLAMLREYRRIMQDGVALKESVRQIRQRSEALRDRPSVRAQRVDAAAAARLRLVWLADDERVCVRPELADAWPQPAVAAPFYPRPGETVPWGQPTIIRAPDGLPATLTRWRSTDPFGRLHAAIRGRRWRSPAARMARRLFEDERDHRPGSRLLAFGQCITGPLAADSFVLSRGEQA